MQFFVLDAEAIEGLVADELTQHLAIHRQLKTTSPGEKKTAANGNLLKIVFERFESIGLQVLVAGVGLLRWFLSLERERKKCVKTSVAR